jgi:zinc carboxypeptidase
MKSGSICVLLGCAATASAQVRVEVETFALSRNGEPIEAYTISSPGERDADERPALLIVAGIEPEHRIGIEVARALAERDWSDAAELLATRTLYIIPNVNPDGMVWLEGGNGPVVEMGRTVAPFDADRDGRLGEDPPDDLNGDGIITMMRVYDPPARYGLDLNLVAEDDDERLSRSAKPGKGEVGAFTLITEGLDNDGDGLFNEDGSGGPGSGINLNTNFPTHFPEFREGAGARALIEPESRALVEAMQSHRNIVGVIVLGRGDNLLNKPTTGKFDQTGRIPKGLEKGDQAYHEHMAKLYKDAVSMDKAPKPNLEGSFLSWAYADYGAWAFESAVWSRPKAEKKDADAKDESTGDVTEEESVDDSAGELAKLIAQGVPEEIARFITATPEERQAMANEFESASDEERQAKMAAVGSLPPEIQARMMAAIQQVAGGEAGGEPEAKPATKAKRAKPNDSDDGRWLTYSDESRDGSGFIEWTPFDHPQLGSVEIGGFVPGFKINPPDGLAADLAEEQANFALALLEALPSVEVGKPMVERLGSNLWRVSVEVCNPGYLPTSSTVGLKIRQPIAVDLAVEPERVAVGRRVVVLDRLLGSGACERVEWVITGDAGEEVDIEVRSARFGTQRVKATLEGDRP